MLKSMTGFGKAECQMDDKKITIEIKTLNSKQFDLQTRLPNPYRQKELDVRTILMKKLERGKSEITLTVDQSETADDYSINIPLAKKYFSETSKLANELGLETGDNLLSTILKLPDVLKSVEKELDETEWQKILQAIEMAASNCDSFRTEEGRRLEKDFVDRISLILEFLDGIKEFEEERINKITAKFRKELTDVLGSRKIDENRFEQEIIYYLEKIDITEEKVRLKHNCDYFMQAMAEDESNGKKLNFISQEIGREINTIGSKANDSNIQKFVVQMKDELEKVKEQMFNIL